MCIRDSLNEPAAMRELSQMPLLPLTAKQRGMIGETRAQEAEKAQLHARGIQALASDPKPLKRVSFFPSASCKDPNVTSSSWSSSALSEVFAGTTRTGNHVCRPD
eukprot:11886029-Karenia_brevis.AAC.1